MISLRDSNYEYNKVEMIINITDKFFDGEIHKATINIKFKFGIQCSEKSIGLKREFKQKINQEIL